MGRVQDKVAMVTDGALGIELSVTTLLAVFLASADSDYITRQTLMVEGGITKLR